MGRPKNVDIRNKRKKQIVLSKRAYELVQRHKDSFPSWNFSEFVNQQVIEKMDHRTDRDILVAELNHLQAERDKLVSEFERKMDHIAKKISGLESKNAI